VTELPVVEYVSDGESPVVERVNQAFVETFDITDEMTGIPLSTTLASVTVPNDEYGPILDSARRGSETVVTCQCETATGNRSFRIRTTQADGGGYVVFTETLGSERLDVLKYLTHSLRNPLEVAAVHTEVMADTGTLDHLDTVRTAHERIDAIVTDTMELAQQGTVVEETTTVDIESLAREAWETVRTDDATLQVGSPGTVDADERRLRVVFENLFGNAIRHGRQDGADAEIRVTVDATAGGFYVADDGRGIPAADREQVLDPGYSTDDDGTGLGLAIVAAIAENHGWKLSVRENETGGTRFEFS